MPQYVLTAPNGTKYRVTAPEGASHQDVMTRVQQWHAQSDVKPKLIADVENAAHDPNAVSETGAKGLMQTLPSTLKDPGFGVKPAKDNSPQELKRVGEDYYSAMKAKYKNPIFAAVAYKEGPGYADEWIDQGADWSKLVPRAQTYIHRLFDVAHSAQNPNYKPEWKAQQPLTEVK